MFKYFVHDEKPFKCSVRNFFYPRSATALLRPCRDEWWAVTNLLDVETIDRIIDRLNQSHSDYASLPNQKLSTSASYPPTK
ncbi:hypothetical protein [Tolypothrix sp. NIES-4075]|uniref:hypothetical protein n=1 Tax=Tolypothrix sp. NIES-4075 TaxID=2005459 RepID=UPI000B5C9AFF|nr:hypothetical protein [Tolypothrix sp. NIES-4075]